MLRFVIVLVLSFPVAAVFSWISSLSYGVAYLFAFLILLNASSGD